MEAKTLKVPHQFSWQFTNTASSLYAFKKSRISFIVLSNLHFLSLAVEWSVEWGIGVDGDLSIMYIRNILSFMKCLVNFILTWNVLVGRQLLHTPYFFLFAAFFYLPFFSLFSSPISFFYTLPSLCLFCLSVCLFFWAMVYFFCTS